MNTTALGPKPAGATRRSPTKPATGRVPILRPRGKPVPTTSISHGCCPMSSAGWREPGAPSVAWLSSRSPRRSDRRIRQGDDPGEQPEQPAEDDPGQESGDDQERDPEHPVHRPENEGFFEADQAT